MEDVLWVYQLPYDRRYPVICMDEASKQLIGEVNASLPLRAGRVRCEDYEYERKGVCNQFMCCEPLRGWRHVRVTARRTKRDWAECIRELIDVHYPEATRIRLVLDNLNTHTGASLYEAFPPKEARRLLDRLEIHHTPTLWICLEGRGARRGDIDNPSPGKAPEARQLAQHGGNRNRRFTESMPQPPTGQRRLVAQ